jgi:hypothetical protein
MGFKTLGFTFTALLAFGALWVAGASANSWKMNGSPLTQPRSFTAEGTVEVEERYRGDRYSCAFQQEGTVGPGATGEITGKKVYKCADKGGRLCESAVELEAVHLPWKTELVTVNGVVRYKVTNGGSGKPYWEIKCTGQGGKIEELCTGAETAMGMINVPTGVKASFDSESTKGSCVAGANEMLILNGTETIKNGEGTLSVETPEWLLNGGHLENAVTVATKGTLKFSDAGAIGKPLAECTSTGEGSVGPGNVGTLTKLTLTGCQGNAEHPVCKSGTTVEAQNLPWRTVLVASEGTTREMISDGGKGLPGFKTVCKTIAGTVTDTCTGKTSALSETVTGGVDETFDSHAEKLECTLGGAGQGAIQGTVLIENPSSGTLSFKAS